MTPDEAIKLNEELKNLLPEVGFNKYTASIQLGIEALRRIKEQRDYRFSHMSRLLPGETNGS